MGKRRPALSDSDDDEQESPQLCIKKLMGTPQEEERSNLGKEETRPVGRMIRVERRGNELRTHYGSFEHAGTVYELGDSVLMSPLEEAKKPDLAIIKIGTKVCWPDAVIPIITALERVTYEALDFQKYNQKMRQLEFNIKNSPSLARRLLNKELEPISLLTMTPDELKEGLTADERIVIEPEQTDQIQMTDARCSRCMEKQVCVCDVICAGGDRDRYQLECNACGNTWFAARDDLTSLTTDAPKVVGNVGTAPWATAKFEDGEKKLVSPGKSQSDAFKKSADAYFPVLETQKSFSKSRTAYPISAPHKSFSKAKTEPLTCNETVEETDTTNHVQYSSLLSS